MRRVLGLDPGPSHSGWALLESGAAPSARPRWLACGEIASTSTEIAALIGGQATAAGATPFVVAVEIISGYTYGFVRTSAINATSNFAGIIEGLAVGLSVRVERMPASTWRLQMTGKGNAKDSLIKRALLVLVEGVPSRTNVHERDAAGAAFAVLQRLAATASVWKQAADSTVVRA